MNDFTNMHFDPFGKKNAFAEATRGEDLLADFTAEQIDSLLRVRSAITVGRYSETTEEYRRLLFARWLVSHGRLQG
jgi:hypothetical protein